MIVTPTARVVVPTLFLVAACGAALVFGFTHVRPQRSVESRAMSAVQSVPPHSSGTQNQNLAGLAQTEADAIMGELAVPPSSPDADGVPIFDVARIEPNGEAVIAGRAAPGATVELLFDGKVYDRAVADQAGQFVMIPPRLPPGDHELTLRSAQWGGKQVTSVKSVLVALHSNPGDVPSTYKMSQPAIRSTKPQQSVLMALHSGLGDVSPADQSREAIRVAKRRGFAALRKQQTTAPTPLLNEHPSSVTVAPDTATTVVSGGDSLWRISRLSYGRGERYPVIYDANRNQIQNPNRIFPGQIIVIPDKAH